MGSTATYYSCNTGTYYYDVTVASTWSSNNTPVIQMDSSVRYRADGMAGGTANVTGGYSDCTQFDNNPDFDCPCINYQTYTASGGGVVVQITGPNTVWWFNGQTPSGYATTITLTALVSSPSMRENMFRWAEEVSGRPFCAEARCDAESLVGRSAPRPLLRRRGRISGTAEAGSLCLQARRETIQGRGAETSAYRRRLP
jgi:hypothetical protein